MYWKNHNKWALKLGISKEVSRYVNNIIDVISVINLPQEYLDFVNKESRKIAEQSKRKVGIIAMVIESKTLEHDSARKEKKTMGKIVSEIQLKFLETKGKDFVKAWYLHHALDYLNDNRDWIKNVPTETINTLFTRYQKNKPVTFSREIIDFLKKNIQELRKDLNL